MALGYQAVANTKNTISFGHVAGDTYYASDPWDHTISTNTFKDTFYNRLVNVADGIDDHDVVVMEQLTKAKAEAVATAKNQIKVKGDETNVHAEETTDQDGVQTTTISLKPKVTLKDSTDTTGAKQVVLDGTAGTITAGLSTDTTNFISLDGTQGLAKVGAIQIGNQSFTYTYMKPGSLNDDGATLNLESTRASATGNFVTGLSNRTWTPGNYVTGRAATEDELEQAGRHFLSIKTADKDDNGNPITPVAENSLANYYNDGASGSASMAFGVGTTAEGDHSLSMGVKSSASGLNSLAIGYDNTASGTQSVAVGNGTNASGNFSVAMGLGSQAGTQNTDPESTDNGAAVAVGFEASAEQTGSAAYGYMASANNFESSAFGTSATANADGSVALGAHSVANRDKGISGYLVPTSMTPDNAAVWISTDGAVSLGGKTKNDAGQDVTISRQITNLAAGSEDSDAVNVAQLKALASQGMNFQGNDTSTSVHLDQGGTLQIQGSGRKKDEEYSTQNVKVLTDTANKRLSIALDKNPVFDSVTAGTEGTSADGGQAGYIKIVGANSSSTNKATTITAGYAASPELSGAKGTGRISYTDGDGTAHTVATLGDGLKLAGDTGTGSVALDNTLTVSGGAQNLANGNNIGVTAQGSTLSLKLAKDITGLDTVTAGGVKMGTQTDGNDTTKSGKYVTGLDNTTWTVGQTQPVTGRAATEDQLKSVSNVVSSNTTQITTNTDNIAKGLNFSASNKIDGAYKTVNRALGSTVAVRANDAQSDHTYKTDNLTTEIDDNGIITVKMDTQLTADKVTVGTGDNAITIDGSNGSLKTSSSTLNGTGLTINNGPSVTTSGISGGSKRIADVASGKSGDDNSGNPVYGIETNAANIGDVKKIAAKMVTVSGDNKNTKVVGTPNTIDGTVDYKVSLNDSVTLGSDADKKIALDGTAGTVSVGDKITLNGNAGTVAIGGATLGNDGADTYLTGLTNKTWDPNNITSGRAATEDQLQTVSDTVNSGWKAQINGTDVKTVTPTDNTLNFVAGDNISLSIGKDIEIATTPDVNFTTVRVGGTNTNGTYTGGILLGNQAGGGANGSADSPIMSITGLKNTAWVKDNFMSGRAATEDQLNAVAQQIKGEVNAADIYVESGAISYDTKGDGTGTLQRSNNTTGQITGLHDYYVTGGSVSADGKTLNLTKNGGDAIPGIDLTDVLNQDSHLVAADSGEYTVDSDGKVTLKVKNNAAGSTPTDVVISGIASNAALQQGLNFEANGAENIGGSAAYNAQLGGTVKVLGGTANGSHTYNTDNITTTMDNGTITVKLDNDLTAHSLTAGSNTVNGTVRVTGTGGAYIEMDGSDGSLHMGNNGGRYSALYQDYGGASFLNSADSSPRLKYDVDTAKGTYHTIATLEDGLQLAGDNGDAIDTTLNKKVTIKGGAKTKDLVDSTDSTKNNNIGVTTSTDNDGNTVLSLQLAKNITGLNTVTAGSVVMGNQNVISVGKVSGQGSFITGLDNKTWDGTDYVSGRAGTEDQLKKVSDSIQTSVNNAQFGITAGGLADGGDVTVKKNLGESIRIYGDAPVTNEKNDGSGDFWDRSKANILTKVKKDHDGNDYVSVELQDHLEVGVHGDIDAEGTDGSMQFKGKSAKEVNITGDTGITLSDGDGQTRTQTAALRQANGAGYLDLTGTTAGTKATVSVHTGAQNLAQQDQTRLTYTDQGNKPHDVATLEDGLIFAGDIGGNTSRTLNGTLKISGGVKDKDSLSTGANIGVVTSDDGLKLQLAKNLTGIESITGLTNTTITSSDFATKGRAATEEQLVLMKGSITDFAKGGGFGLTDSKGNAVKADLGNTIGVLGDSNITTSVSDDGKSIDIKLNNQVDLGDEGSITAGGVTINNSGIDAGGKNITDVKSGIVNHNDSDNSNAANIGDVKQLAGEAAKGAVDSLGTRDFTGDDGEKISKKLGESMKLSGGADTTKLTDGNIGVVKNANGDGLDIKLSSVLKGLTSVTTGNSTLNNDGLTINNSEGKAGTTITNSGIKITANGDNTHDVEIGNSNVSMGGQQIHDVAAGTSATDAVNVGQLSMFANNVGSAINKLDNRVNRVGAGAAALAALHPLDFDPDDKWDFAGGFGHYKNANAAAIGAYYRPNEDTMFSIGGSFGGGENMLNAGVSFKLGQGNHVSTSRTMMAKEIESLKAVVKEQNEKLQENENLREKVDKQDKEIAELKAMVQQLAARR